jgi:hypothetical protein
MLGGITPMPPAPGIRRRPPGRVTPGEPRGDLPRRPAREPTARPDIEDIPPSSGESRKPDGAGPIGLDGRDRNDKDEPPPMRLGMNPSNVPL